MPKAYFSTVIPINVDDLWKIARDFGNYHLFTSGRGETFIEDDLNGQTVGAIRNATLDGRTVRQRLISHSDIDRCYQYEFLDGMPLAIEDYVATLRFLPVTDSDQSFVEWSAVFECAADQRGSLRDKLESLFSGWAKSLSETVRM